MHLDTDLYEPTIFSLKFFDGRFVAGSTFMVDDYQTKSCPGIRRAVAEFLETHPNYAAYHPLTEQCVLIETAKE